MFSKQLKYSYLMYEYIKNSSQEYNSGKEVVEMMNIPKSWGIELLYNMVKKNLLGTKKGKGFYYIKQKLNFWDFYIKVEELKLKSENFIDFKEKDYMIIVKNIGFIVQREMRKIKM